MTPGQHKREAKLFFESNMLVARKSASSSPTYGDDYFQRAVSRQEKHIMIGQARRTTVVFQAGHENRPLARLRCTPW